MLKCRSCSAEAPETSRFCPSCGAALIPDPFTTADISVSEPSPQGASQPTPKLTPRPAAKPQPKVAEASRSGARISSGGLATEDRFMLGSRLAGRYRIVARLDRGGMGEVYRADDLTLGQPVALKFLPEAASKTKKPWRDSATKSGRPGGWPTPTSAASTTWAK